MPNYDYECRACGHRFECFQKMTDPKLDRCPECGGRLERLIGPGAGVVFKGSGFYQTDYRSKSYRDAARSERAPAGGEAAGKPDAGQPAGGAKEGGTKEGGTKKTAEKRPAPEAKPSDPPGKGQGPAAKPGPGEP
jgi:putative FmdB family regulatory protein